MISLSEKDLAGIKLAYLKQTLIENGDQTKKIGEYMQKNFDEHVKEKGAELWRAGCMMLCWADDMDGNNG